MKRGIWFPAIRAHTGADVFTEQLAGRLEKAGFQVAIDWLPLHAEFAPWAVRPRKPPEWAGIAHVNSWLAARFIPAGLKVVSTIHHSTHDPRLRPYKGLARACYHQGWMGRLERGNLARADAIVAVSHAAAYWAREIFGIEQIRVIHNGIDLEGMAALPREEPNTPFRLIYVGSWAARKGVDLIPKIMRRLGPGFELLCVGGRIRDTAASRLPDNIRFLGRIGDRCSLIQVLQDSDAFLFPSRSEGLSLALIEAQACGLPVVGADCSSMPEVVANDLSGLLCPLDDVGAYVAAVEQLAEDKGLWLRMRAFSGARAREAFDIGRQVEEYVSLYGSLLRY